MKPLFAVPGLILLATPLSASGPPSMLQSYPYLDKCLVAMIEPMNADYSSVFYDCGTSLRVYEMVTLVPTKVEATTVLFDRPIAYVMHDQTGNPVKLNDPAQDGLNGNETVVPTKDVSFSAKLRR